MKWPDVTMLALACAIVGLTAVSELEEIHFTFFWFRINKSAPTPRRSVVKALLWLLCTVRALVLIPLVLAVTPLITFTDGADAKNLALNSLAALFILEVDELVFSNMMPRSMTRRMPEAVQLLAEDAWAHAYARYVFLIGALLGTAAPFAIVALVERRPDTVARGTYAGWASTEWIAMEQPGVFIFLALAHLTFAETYRTYVCDCTALHTALPFRLAAAWVIARLFCLPVPAETVLYKDYIHPIWPPDPYFWHYLSYANLNQFVLGEMGVVWYRQDVTLYMAGLLVCAIALGAVTALPVICCLVPRTGKDV